MMNRTSQMVSRRYGKTSRCLRNSRSTQRSPTNGSCKCHPPTDGGEDSVINAPNLLRGSAGVDVKCPIAINLLLGLLNGNLPRIRHHTNTLVPRPVDQQCHRLRTWSTDRCSKAFMALQRWVLSSSS